VFFLPYLTGERCPWPDPYARGGWIGISARTTRCDLIRALLEGVTFGMRDALEIMREMKIPITQVRASGGGARSEFWRRLQADIYNTPIVLTNAAEGPAYGVALLAGVGIGAFKSVEEACKASIRQIGRIAPNRKLAALYERHYSVYRSLYPALKDRFAQIARLNS
jgi:xylulokinase